MEVYYVPLTNNELNLFLRLKYNKVAGDIPC